MTRVMIMLGGPHSAGADRPANQAHAAARRSSSSPVSPVVGSTGAGRRCSGKYDGSASMPDSIDPRVRRRVDHCSYGARSLGAASPEPGKRDLALT